MGWGLGAHRSGPGDWRFPLYFLPPLPPPLHQTQILQQPPPRRWKKPVLRAAVGGQVFTSENAGLCRVSVRFIRSVHRPQTSFSSSPLCSPPVPAGETAAPAGPSIDVYRSFRAIPLRGSVQAGEAPLPALASPGRRLGPDSAASLGCVAGWPCSMCCPGGAHLASRLLAGSMAQNECEPVL